MLGAALECSYSCAESRAHCCACYHGHSRAHSCARCPVHRHACRDYVKKIAVYKDKLAVQLPSKIVIYELANPNDDYDMHYQVRECALMLYVLMVS